MQDFSRRARKGGRRIAVVPTMGALHEGHLSLIRLAKAHADVVICTIFVNPTQFGPNEDFSRYPRSLDADSRGATAAGAHVVFAPSVDEMYPAGSQTFVDLDRLPGVYEGKVRPGHFRGVATVVTKLFTATLPDTAVFGQKDAQQVAVVKTLTRELNLGITIVVGPIVREPDGLALSSRNVYLSPEERSAAPSLYRSLRLGENLVRGGERDLGKVRRAMHAELVNSRPTAVDYIAFVHPDSFEDLAEMRPEGTLAVLAVRFGTTRLLDNHLMTTQGESR